MLLKAPLERVWRALSDAEQFGAWFGVKFEGPFVAGEHVKGTIVPTQVDAEIAKMQEPLVGLAVDLAIVRIEPMRVFSFRWHRIPLERRAKAFTADDGGWKARLHLCLEKYLVRGG